MSKRIPVWKNIRPKRHRVRSFLAKHNKVLVVTGALIVFVTFVVKERFHQSLKENADAYEAAEERYLREQEIGEIAVQVHLVREESSLTLNQIFKISGAGTIASNNRVATLRARLDAIESSMRSMTGLIDDWDDEEQTRSATEAVVVLDGLIEQSVRVRDLLEKENLDLDILKNIESETKKLEDRSRLLGAQMLKAERKRQSTFRDASEVYKFFGFLCYTVGWSLSLVASLFGTEGFRKLE
jgi:hypothetical protein